MSGPYLVMVDRNFTWLVIDAWATETLAMADVELKKAAAAKKMGYTPNGGWERPRTQLAFNLLGSKFPGKVLKIWSATSVGGMGGNHWAHIAVVELIVQGTVLDEIVEAIK